MKKFRIKKEPFIFEVRDLWPELPKAMGIIKSRLILRFLSYLEKQAYKHADFGVGLSPGICEGMKRFGSLTDEIVKLIPNGCDLDFFQGIAVSKIKNERLKHLLNNYKTAVFSGAHGVANGLDQVLLAAELLQKQGNKEIAFLFIGDGKCKPELIKHAKDKQLTNCHFFDPIPKDELIAVLKQATVGLMILKNVEAFYYGTSPNKFFDYIASGLPVLNNYPGWIAEMIQEYNCGCAVAPENSNEFVRALLYLTNLNDDDYKQMSESAINLANKFNRSILSKEFIKICESTQSKNIGLNDVS